MFTKYSDFIKENIEENILDVRNIKEVLQYFFDEFELQIVTYKENSYIQFGAESIDKEVGLEFVTESKRALIKLEKYGYRVGMTFQFYCKDTYIFAPRSLTALEDTFDEAKRNGHQTLIIEQIKLTISKPLNSNTI